MPVPAQPTHLIPPSALSLKVTSTPLFSVPSGSTQVSRVAICFSQLSHCSGSCLMRSCQQWRAWDRPGEGKVVRMAWEQDYYDVYEAARVLEIPPARVRKMLRAGELQGERGEPVSEGAPGPWRLPASAVHAARSVMSATDAEETVAISSEESVSRSSKVSEGTADEAPSETSERLSEGVQDLREKAGALITGLDALEGRLEAAEIEQLALKEELRRAEERSESLQTELEQERTRAEPQEQKGPVWRRWLGGG